MTVYRVISEGEWLDFSIDLQFRTGDNTLEAKQFFRSRIGVMEFLRDSRTRNFNPPYTKLLIVHLDEMVFSGLPFDEQELDRHIAITIQEADLAAFNQINKFVVFEDV